MKIRKQGANHTKLEFGKDEDIGFAAPCADRGRSIRAQRIPGSRELQRPDRGSPHGDHPPILSQRAVDLRGRSLRDRVALAMELVVLYLLRVHRLKSSQAHMQSQFGDLNSSFAYVSQDLWRKVQACGGRGDAAGGLRAGIDRLVAFAVFLPVFARDIGRQRDVSQLLQDGKKIRHGIKVENALAEFPSGNHFGSQFRGLREI